MADESPYFTVPEARAQLKMSRASQCRLWPIACAVSSTRLIDAWATWKWTRFECRSAQGSGSGALREFRTRWMLTPGAATPPSAQAKATRRGRSVVSKQLSYACRVLSPKVKEWSGHGHKPAPDVCEVSK